MFLEFIGIWVLRFVIENMFDLVVMFMIVLFIMFWKRVYLTSF